MNIRGGGRDPSKSKPEPLDGCSSNLDSFFTTEISRWGAGARWLISESVDGGWLLFAQASPGRLHTTPPPADRSAGFSPEIKSTLITLPIQQPAAQPSQSMESRQRGLERRRLEHPQRHMAIRNAGSRCNLQEGGDSSNLNWLAPGIPESGSRKD
jgi:hypothetical protein